jgi:hypothetical protein
MEGSGVRVPASALTTPRFGGVLGGILLPTRSMSGSGLVTLLRVLAYLRRHHLAILALFIALGGTSYAATQLPANSVGTRQIRAGAVTPSKLSPALRSQLGKTTPKAKAAWRDPAIMAAISAAGQRVLSQKLVTVAADAPWVDTGLSIAPGQRLWADTRSDGKWSGNPRYFPYSDANGLPVYPGAYRVDANAQVDSLIGFIGSTPVNAPEVSVNASAQPGGPGGITNPGFVAVGDTLVNFAPQTTGEIWLRNNDNTNYYSDVGRQIVKVIVTTG